MNASIDVQRLVPAWQELQSVAPVYHIQNDGDYRQATELLNQLLDLVRDDNRHPLYSLVGVIGDLIEAYEMDHDPA